MKRLFFSKKHVIRLCLLAALMPAVALGGIELWWLHHAKRFQEVRKGFLYRTGQPSEDGLRYLIQSKGIRTVLSLQTFDPKLRTGNWDPGKPDGEDESEFARRLNLKFEQWPLGEEACWPWPAPWHLEEYFKLLDEPSNRPILIHCQGGRHRTGTLAALFRLEYDHWSIDRVLNEMYSFKFGKPIPWQELNLRTYWPRPQPTIDQWRSLRDTFGSLVGSTAPVDYDALVLALRHFHDGPRLRERIAPYLSGHGPFALPLAVRLIDTPDDPLAALAANAATEAINAEHTSTIDRAAAAALIADFGNLAQQQKLLDLVINEPHTLPVRPQYAALVIGLTNRYTRNRLPYLKPLLNDMRPRPEPQAGGTRYCDTAIARMTGIVDEPFYDRNKANGWENGRWNALAWFDKHASEVSLTQLILPRGPQMVRVMQPGDEREGPRRR